MAVIKTDAGDLQLDWVPGEICVVCSATQPYAPDDLYGRVLGWLSGRVGDLIRSAELPEESTVLDQDLFPVGLKHRHPDGDIGLHAVEPGGNGESRPWIHLERPDVSKSADLEPW